MLKFFKKRSNQRADNDAAPNTLPKHNFDGCAYVIGDIHGCFKELEVLLKLIENDCSNSPQEPKYVVFLGDLMDRGPQTNDVIETLSHYNPDYAKPIFITGNHEEMFLRVLSGDVSALRSWFEFGGRETSRSYGVDNLGAIFTQPENVLRQLRQKVPQAHIDFLSSFQNYFEFGPYLCVHAGIKPEVPLEEQRSKDFRWIRSAFLDYKKQHPFIVVHGHSVVEEGLALPNRIAVDTGCYKGGPLTAVKLEQSGTTFIETPSQQKIQTHVT